MQEISELAEGDNDKLLEFFAVFGDGHQDIPELAEGDVHKILKFHTISDDVPKEVSEPTEGDIKKMLEVLAVFEDPPKEVSEPAEGDINKSLTFVTGLQDGPIEISELALGNIEELIKFLAVFQQDPLQSTASVSESIPTVSPNLTCFMITLDRSTGMKLGIDVRCESGDAPWVVESIDGGLVAAWNEAACLGKQVKPGDIVIQANGISDANRLIEECRKAQVLTLQLQRPEAERPRLSSLRPLAISPPESPANTAPLFLHWPCSPDWSSINAAVADSPLSLSETYKVSRDTPPQGTAEPHPRQSNVMETLLRGRHMFESLSLPSSIKGYHSGGHRWKIISGSTPKNVQHGARFVKSKARRVVVKTRRGFANIQALPARVNIQGLHTRCDSTRVVIQSLHTRCDATSELTRAKVHKSMSTMVEYVKDHVESAQVSEKALRGLDYVKKQASTASSIISEQMSDAAIKISRNLGKVGGA